MLARYKQRENQHTYPTFSCPVIRRCTSSTFSAFGRQRTTWPFKIWLEASLSAPRSTITSLSRLHNCQQNLPREKQGNIPNLEESRAGFPSDGTKEVGHFCSYIIYVWRREELKQEGFGSQEVAMVESERGWVFKEEEERGMSNK